MLFLAMTIAQLIECILGKVGCYTGNIGNGTAFDRISVDNISKMLLSCIAKHGNEILYNGKTGANKLKHQSLWGPTYY